jgi:hypothetical protein
MSLLRPPGATPLANYGDLIRDSTGSVEDQERSSLDEFFHFPFMQGDGTSGGGAGDSQTQTPEQALEQWFENNRNASAQEIFNVMQANNVSPEYVINQWGLDPESAMATYNTF